jgi:hypothetical protein
MYGGISMKLERVLFIAALLALSATYAFAGGLGVNDNDLDMGTNPTTAWLDLENTSMILKAPTIGTYETVRWWLGQGFDFQSWDGYGPYGVDSGSGDLLFPENPGGIVSTAGANSGGMTMLGLLSGQEYMDYWSTDFYGVDVTSIPGAVLVRYTYAGDSNFSGTSDIDDYSLFQYANQANNDSDPENDVPNTWLNGDWNYSNTIDIDDYGMFQFANQNGAGDTPIEGGGGISAIPEPSTILLVISALVCGLVIRRRFV